MATTNGQGTVIYPNEATPVTEENGELRPILPKYVDDEGLPPLVLLLADIRVAGLQNDRRGPVHTAIWGI